MSEALKAVFSNQNSKLSGKYFSFQIKGWTNFDPMDKTLANVADHIERGEGFLTLVEVVRIENEVASIDDEEARECFENLLAAKRLIQNLNELPATVREELRAALKSEGGVDANKIVTLAPSPAVGEEAGSRVKRWP